MDLNDTQRNQTEEKLLIEEEIQNILIVYMVPFIIIIGTIANILSMIVLSRKSMRRSTTMFYLLNLSVADLMVLHTGLLRLWIKGAFELDIRLFNDFICKTHVFLVYFSLDVASWILVAVTIERCVSVTKPLKAKIFCTSKNSKVIILTIFGTMALINCPLLFTVEINMKNGQTVCGATDETKTFIKYIWPWIDFAAFCLFPFFIMIVANILIIRKIDLSTKMPRNISKEHFKKFERKKHISQTSNAGVRTPDMDSELNSNHQISRFSRLVSFIHRKKKYTIEHAVNETSFKAKTNITFMLLSVNMVFFLCTLPVAVYFIGEKYWETNVTNWTPKSVAISSLIFSATNILQYINNAVHFFLYCLTGTRFRKEFIKLFTRRGQPATFNSNSVS